MSIGPLISKILRPGLIALALTGATLASGPAVAQPYFSFGFGTGGYAYSAPYWAYHHRHHHRYLTYCEIYPYAYVCRPHHRHHHHDYMDDYWGDDWGGY